MTYDDFVTTPPAMPTGNGRTPSARYHCEQCGLKLDATSAVRHHNMTAHTITMRGVVQKFSFTPTCRQVSVEELVTVGARRTS